MGRQLARLEALSLAFSPYRDGNCRLQPKGRLRGSNLSYRSASTPEGTVLMRYDDNESQVGKPIAVVQGSSSAIVQNCLTSFVERHKATIRIVGLLESTAESGGAPDCRPSRLRSIGSPHEFPLFQDLGQGAISCSLLPQSLIEAAELVRLQIRHGCDLVVLSKYGKLEAECASGLVPAFVAALEAHVPVLTSVSSRFLSAWDEFATPYFQLLQAEHSDLECWWQNMYRGTCN